MKKVRIELQNISKSYYSETAVTQALRKISLSFSMGEFVAITGESGSGKSTLLNIIGGMDSFDEGEMVVDGETTFQYDDEDWETYRRTKIGYVFQDYSLIGHYTALDNIMSALLIMGHSKEEAERISIHYLDQVGLKGYETHRASELSSGQKQRLSIARALAKDTGIIVADEPTGNLDSETGIQIIQLLKELSKTRLVIMVTHNYDQAEAYVTRKIRLHDGQMISDVEVHSDTQTAPGPEESSDIDSSVSTGSDPERSVSQSSPKQNNFRSQNRMASHFARRNRRTQRGRAILFTSFLLVIAVASFLFIGELYVHKEDYSTRAYTQAAFYHKDEKRLVVKRADGKDISDEDIEKISSVPYVETVDSCDLANDINFFMDEGTDYKYIYGDDKKRSRISQGGEMKRVSFLKEDRFMMSSDAITEEDLAAGHLPQNRDEIVLYAKDTSMLDTTILCYFVYHNVWSQNDYYQKNLTITGILKEPTRQVYFSRDLCRMLSLNLADNSVLRIHYEYDKGYGDFRKKTELVPIIGEGLDGNAARLSAFTDPESLTGGATRCTIQRYDDDGKAVGNLVTDTLEINSPGTSGEGLHDSASRFIEVSEDFFNQYYTLTSPQASVYISSYAKTDAVLKKLERLGYEGISSFRISAMEYIDEEVTQRLTIIGISTFGLFILLLAEVLILRSLMKIRIKDYFVLKFIGMKLKVIRRISYFEMTVYTAIAVLITIALMWILRLSGLPIIQEIMWYYSISAYLVFVLYNFLLILLTVAFFNRLLKGRLNA